MKTREKRISQLSIFHTMPRNEVARELEAISRILDDNPGIYALVYQDMVRTKRPDTGHEGMTAEQVLRCTILKQYRNLSYEELAFHLEDSLFVSCFFSAWNGSAARSIDPSGEHQGVAAPYLGGGQ